MPRQMFPFFSPRLRPGCAVRTDAAGRLARPAGALGLMLMACQVPVQALAQSETVYRCGQNYTNAPPAHQLCERLPALPITVIEGTRVQRPSDRSPAAGTAAASGAGAVPGAAVSPVTTAPAPPLLQRELQGAVQPGQQRQEDRQAQARAVLLDELSRTRERHAQLQRELQALEAPAADPARAQALQQSLSRSQRDLQSLQRELERFYPEGRR